MRMDAKTAKFMEQLVQRVKNERVFDSVTKGQKLNEGTWDSLARQKVGKIVEEVFKESYPNEDARKALWIEGSYALWEMPNELIGSAGINPEIGILSPKKIGIELEHSEKGSEIKTVLGKATFICVSGEWDYFFVFYHIQDKKSLDEERGKKLRKNYEDQFNTKIVLF